ncbi:MAG: hypothetical protein ABEI53_00440, partial [Candidatus Magasanikbacteria bacterium]
PGLEKFINPLRKIGADVQKNGNYYHQNDHQVAKNEKSIRIKGLNHDQKEIFCSVRGLSKLFKKIMHLSK